MRRLAIRCGVVPHPLLALVFSLVLGATHVAAAAGHDATLNQRGPSLEERLGELHPLVVHFPIAMLLSAALSEALLAATGRASFRDVTRFMVWIGALGAVSAAPLGWFAGATTEDLPPHLLESHRWLGVSTALWSIATLWACERVKGSRAILRGMVAGAAVLAAATGYLGGELVHDPQAWSDIRDE